MLCEDKMKNKRSIFISFLALAVIILLLFIRITNRTANGKQENKEVTPTVEIYKAEVGHIQNKVNYTGNVEGIFEAMIISQTSGTVVKENVKVGDKIYADQPLFVVENEMQKANVEQAKAQVLAAETNYEKALNDLKRIEKLYEERVATKDNLELAQLNVKSTLAALKGAQAALKVAEKQLADTYISSKFSGKLGSKKVSVGQTVAPGTEIGKVVDDSRLKISIMVYENDISKIKVSQKVKITIDAIPNKYFEGRVNTVGLATDNNGRAYPVEIMIDNSKDSEIKSGMFARCEIETERKENTIVIPEKAVVSNNDGKNYVFVVENGRAIMKNIEVGIRTSDLCEVLSGINAGDNVIIVGHQRVENNAPVKVHSK